MACLPEEFLKSRSEPSLSDLLVLPASANKRARRRCPDRRKGGLGTLECRHRGSDAAVADGADDEFVGGSSLEDRIADLRCQSAAAIHAVAACAVSQEE